MCFRFFRFLFLFGFDRDDVCWACLSVGADSVPWFWFLLPSEMAAETSRAEKWNFLYERRIWKNITANTSFVSLSSLAAFLLQLWHRGFFSRKRNSLIQLSLSYFPGSSRGSICTIGKQRLEWAGSGSCYSFKASDKKSVGDIFFRNCSNTKVTCSTEVNSWRACVNSTR